ncbi:hypothetical protein [Ferruginivarius sediminum]|uniref:hypothetical protein n=1 Tax=Ferruginivarius sediminum TaxID=2661937 RepID=UPI0011C040B7|nr:hypothetical protein [Ferruginivarius sediminum]
MTVASLSGQLLARKGTARPSAAVPRGAGVETSLPSRAPLRVAPPQEPPAAGGERARISLRLDPERHRRLRLAAAHLDCSLQDLLIAALDEHLSGLRLGCACFREGAEACRNGCQLDEEDRAS